jgi:hypothetical protein
MNSRKSVMNVLNEAEKTVMAVSAPATTVSIRTVCQRRILGMIAWRVRPEEYRSTLLIANSWTTTNIRYGIRNQPGNACGSPEMGSVAEVTAVATAAPRRLSSVDAT